MTRVVAIPRKPFSQAPYTKGYSTCEGKDSCGFTVFFDMTEDGTLTPKQTQHEKL